jgi:hypothetical protein
MAAYHRANQQRRIHRFDAEFKGWRSGVQIMVAQDKINLNI